MDNRVLATPFVTAALAVGYAKLKFNAPDFMLKVVGIATFALTSATLYQLSQPTESELIEKDLAEKCAKLSSIGEKTAVYERKIIDCTLKSDRNFLNDKWLLDFKNNSLEWQQPVTIAKYFPAHNNAT